MNFNLMSIIGQIMSNPLGALRQKYDNIPAEINDPKEAVMFLINNGTAKPEQINQAKQMYSNPFWQSILRLFMK